jgi:hypothetical protein
MAERSLGLLRRRTLVEDVGCQHGDVHIRQMAIPVFHPAQHLRDAYKQKALFPGPNCASWSARTLPR